MRRTLMALMATAGLLSAAAAEDRSFDNDLRQIPGQRRRRGEAHPRDEDDPPVIDTELFVANAKKLGECCLANPTIALITATDKLFQK